MNNHRLPVCLTVLLLLLVLPLTGLSEQTAELTNARAAQLLQAAADTYAPEITADRILGAEVPDACLTHASAARMILQAFGPLPEPHYLRVLIGYWDTAFTDVPEDCAEAVENLTSAGLYIPQDNTRFEPDAAMTAGELAQLIDRIHAYLGESLCDDFCNTVNHALYYETESSLGEDTSWSFNIVTNNFDEEAIVQSYIDLLNEALASDGSDPAMTNIAALLSTWLDPDAHATALEELRPYLRSIEEAQTIDELFHALAIISRELGVDVLFDNDPYAIHPIPLGLTGNRIPCYAFETPSLSAPSLYLEDSYEHACMVEQEERILMEYGMSQEQARASVDAYLRLFADAATRLQELPPDWADGMESLEELDAAIPAFPLAEYMTEAGYLTEADFSFSSSTAACAFLSALTGEQLEGLRTYSLLQVLNCFRSAMPLRLLDRLLGLYNDYFSEDPSRYYADYLILSKDILPTVQWDMTDVYARSAEGIKTGQRAMALIDTYVDAYRRMLSQTGWLSEETRALAIGKLDAMGRVYIWSEDRPNIIIPEYIAAEDGGTLLQNLVLYYTSTRATVNAILADAENSNPLACHLYAIGPLECNAYYLPSFNTFYIPFASVQDGRFARADSLEREMATLGFCIGHEISHAFDDSGRWLDASGQNVDWWTPEDQARYDERRDALISLYDSWEYGPGLSQPGSQTIGEAIADNGFLCCSMFIARQQPDFDYNLFFRLCGEYWATITTRLTFQMNLAGDCHPFGRARINPLMMCFDEFHDTYGTTEGDGMYLAPEQRIRFWGDADTAP